MGGICIINRRFGDMVIYMVSEFYVGGADIGSSQVGCGAMCNKRNILMIE